jgi:hypothetical protein
VETIYAATDRMLLTELKQRAFEFLMLSCTPKNIVSRVMSKFAELREEGWQEYAGYFRKNWHLIRIGEEFNSLDEEFTDMDEASGSVLTPLIDIRQSWTAAVVLSIDYFRHCAAFMSWGRADLRQPYSNREASNAGRFDSTSARSFPSISQSPGIHSMVSFRHGLALNMVSAHSSIDWMINSGDCRFGLVIEVPAAGVDAAVRVVLPIIVL